MILRKNKHYRLPWLVCIIPGFRIATRIDFADRKHVVLIFFFHQIDFRVVTIRSLLQARMVTDKPKSLMIRGKKKDF